MRGLDQETGDRDRKTAETDLGALMQIANRLPHQTLALRELPVGPAYAVWTGIGAAGATTVGMIFLGDAVSATKLVSIALILSGVVGLNLSGATP